MTYIEFFDKNAIENICTCLASKPERVILVGYNPGELLIHADRYHKIFLEDGYDIEFITKNVTRNDMSVIIEKLSEIIEEYEDCVFDLTGGEDLYLVACGIISERYRHKNIQMHSYNLRTGKRIDCDGERDCSVSEVMPHLSVEDNIHIYGGTIIYDDKYPWATHRWTINDEFRRDIMTMWEICRQVEPKAWNYQIALQTAAETLHFNTSLYKAHSDSNVSTRAQISELVSDFGSADKRLTSIREIIRQLMMEGLVKSYSEENGILEIKYKSPDIKRVLTKGGLLLEMVVYFAAIEAKEKRGEPTYNDVRQGVCIDWDGELNGGDGMPDTQNEIDVIMMHGVAPVFVSCKSGKVGTDELYKLNSVAERFGGRFATKILVCTTLSGVKEACDSLRQRAHDMSIHIFERVEDMPYLELVRKMRGAWSLKN